MLRRTARGVWASVWALAVVFGGTSVQAATTLLDFSGLNLGGAQPIPQTYGDNAPSTPHVTVTYRDEGGDGLVYWDTGYSDLTDVAYNFVPNNDPGSIDYWMEVELVAEAGYEVALHGFDLGNWLTTDQTIPGVYVFDGSGQTLYSQNNVLVRRRGQPRTSFSFGTPLTAGTLRIRIDTVDDINATNNIGIDNIEFSEVIAVPEPGLALFALLGCAAAGLARSRRR